MTRNQDSPKHDDDDDGDESIGHAHPGYGDDDADADGDLEITRVGKSASSQLPARESEGHELDDADIIEEIDLDDLDDERPGPDA
jgi:hypothetical protein